GSSPTRGTNDFNEMSERSARAIKVAQFGARSSTYSVGLSALAGCSAGTDPSMPPKAKSTACAWLSTGWMLSWPAELLDRLDVDDSRRNPSDDRVPHDVRCDTWASLPHA